MGRVPGRSGGRRSPRPPSCGIMGKTGTRFLSFTPCDSTGCGFLPEIVHRGGFERRERLTGRELRFSGGSGKGAAPA